MDIQKLIESLLAEKEGATNKDKMGAIVDKAIAALKQISEMPANLMVESITENFKEIIMKQDNEIVVLKQQVVDAETIAQDALLKFNGASALIPKGLKLKVEGKNVKVNFGVNYNGQNYTAQELVEKPDLVAELVEIGSGAVTILED
ncbi:hypothetical protein DBR40_24765 [Pedobacter sp. KBW01]|uniref:hypothetical protein n=1 Tax=Pedobacter sp. KBW01 TaxID=2153364 RepID=UPI000F5A774A|nr:hypothetical protein [Pedobacter sp. KBW01]RQO65087.1 hypothetical protein DBR40_24765 [Pedobacter sp. KBW01]